MKWQTWLANVWPALVAGQQVEVPTQLPHPSKVGFEKCKRAEPCGQVADWVFSVDDGARLHVHEFADGRLVVHRDRIDPALSAGHAVWHWLREARSGKSVAGVAAGAAVGAAVLLTGRKDDA